MKQYEQVKTMQKDLRENYGKKQRRSVNRDRIHKMRQSLGEDEKSYREDSRSKRLKSRSPDERKERKRVRTQRERDRGTDSQSKSRSRSRSRSKSPRLKDMKSLEIEE